MKPGDIVDIRSSRAEIETALILDLEQGIVTAKMTSREGTLEAES
jgi:hypothetical protein